MKKVVDAKELNNSEIETIFTAMDIIYRQAKDRGVKAKCVLIEKSKTKKSNSYRFHFVGMSMEDVKKAIASKKLRDEILSI